MSRVALHFSTGMHYRNVYVHLQQDVEKDENDLQHQWVSIPGDNTINLVDWLTAKFHESHAGNSKFFRGVI